MVPHPSLEIRRALAFFDLAIGIQNKNQGPVTCRDCQSVNRPTSWARAVTPTTPGRSHGRPGHILRSAP